MVRMTLTRIPRLIASIAMLASLFIVAIPAAAAGATIAVSSNVVPFSPVPGKAGSVDLTLTDSNDTPAEICVSDNGGPFIPTGIKTPGNGTAAGTAPYIQAGTYTFAAFTSTTAGPPPACAGQIAGSVVKVQRAGPNGIVGADDFSFTPTGDITIKATDYQNLTPLAGKICFMSGDGTQKQINLQLGQDPRVYAAAAIVAQMDGIVRGQNGCYDANWIVNGYYNIGLGNGPGVATPGGSQGALNAQAGFCVAANPPDKTSAAPITPDRHCAQVALAAGGVAVTGGGGP